MKKVAKGFSSIPHLSGSKMTSSSDIRVLNGEQYFTEKVKEKNDIVYVMEKIDGCCMSVSRSGDTLIPATRAGYDIDEGSYPHLKAFVPFVEKYKEFFLHVLQDGDSLYGEWTFAAHGTMREYESLFYIFDIRRGGISVPLMDIVNAIDDYRPHYNWAISYPSFTTGCIKPEKKYIDELHGSSNYEAVIAKPRYDENDEENPFFVAQFEGWIWRSEKNRNGKLIIELAKWVRPGYEPKLPPQ